MLLPHSLRDLLGRASTALGVRRPVRAHAVVGVVAAMLLATAPARAGEEDPVYEIPRRSVTWEEFCAVFDPAWTLPDAPNSAAQPDLVTRVKRLAGERWAEDGDPALRSAGDLLAAARPLSDAGRRRLLDEFAAAHPEAAGRWRELLSQVLLDDALAEPDWDPEDDDADDDGLYLEPTWSLPDDAPAPWGAVQGSRSVHQGAMAIFADLDAIKQTENDFASYPRDANVEYLFIYPVADSHVEAAPEEGAPAMVAVEMHFRFDLPFPFSHCTCRLQIRTRLDTDGHLVTDIVSTSPDYHWLAGRDVFVPLATSDGEPAALLLVRDYGFDLDGVPDGNGTRRASLRNGLVGIKRRAEAAQQAHDGELRPLGGAIPAFSVRGDRRWLP